MNPDSNKWAWKQGLLGIAVVGVVAIIVWTGMSLYRERRAFSKRTSCVGNLIHIRLAKSGCQMDLGIKDGDPIPVRELDKNYMFKPLAQYQCPNGGVYVIGNAGEDPKCTYTNVGYTHYFDVAKLKLRRIAWTHSYNTR